MQKTVSKFPDLASRKPMAQPAAELAVKSVQGGVGRDGGADNYVRGLGEGGGGGGRGVRGS